jgi:hypothetical protein
MTDKYTTREPKTLEDFTKVEKRLCEMCREKNITIDYSNRNFEDIWNGRFNNG